MRIRTGLHCFALSASCGPGGALAADVTYTITNGGVDTKASHATGQVHLHKPGDHRSGVIAWADSGGKIEVPDGSYDVEVTFSDGAAEKTIWLDGQSLTGSVTRTVEIGLPVAEASYTITNNGQDTKGTHTTGQFHIHPAGRHDGGTIAWGDSGGHVRVPAGHYDVQITFSDGAAEKTVWLDNQNITGTVSGSVEIGMQVADASYTITNNGEDTKGTQTTGQFHLHPAGHHDGRTIAWGNSDDHVRVPAGDYDVEITFEDGASHRTVWLDHQTLSGTVTKTVEAGVLTADVSYTITNNGEDTKGTQATGQFHLHPAGHHDGGTVAWGNTAEPPTGGLKRAAR